MEEDKTLLYVLESCTTTSVSAEGTRIYDYQFKVPERNIFYEARTGKVMTEKFNRLYTLDELKIIFKDRERNKGIQYDAPCFNKKSKPKNRTYLTHAEAISFGEYLHSDFRRLLKQREAKASHEAGTVDFMPWSQSMRVINQQDLSDWKRLYFEHSIINYNDIDAILKVW